MPKEEKTVDIDTSGEGAEINIEEQKDESVVETEAPKQETEDKVEQTGLPVINEEKAETPVEEKKEEVKDDNKLEEYSKGVQSRIAKLTRKMREAERQKEEALRYADSVNK